MLTYIDLDLRDRNLVLFAAEGIRQLELLLAKHAEFERRFPT